MAEVWLAHDPDLDRDVAIKTVRAEYARDPEYLQRFLREARSAAQLHHTNTAAIYRVDSEGQTAYIAMEFVDGGSLDKIVKERGPLPWREATEIIRDAATGLAVAHEIGLVHRDIKPANLMRTVRGVTKVVDFGLAKAASSDGEISQAGMLMGSPAYIAPELWAGEPATASSDIYALALTYFYLLAGRPPFEAEQSIQVSYQHRHVPLPDLRNTIPDLPERLVEILNRAAAKKPEERYSTARDLRADLDALLTARAETPAPAPRRNRELAFALLLGLLVLVVVIIVSEMRKPTAIAKKGGSETTDPKASPIEPAKADAAKADSPPSVRIVDPEQAAANRAERLSNLKELVHAMTAAHSDRFPPQAIFSPGGTRLLSWRVALLPQLGEMELYKEFRLNQPWDSPHNKRLIARMPAVFESPGGLPLAEGQTRFLVPAGKGTMFEGDASTRTDEVKDSGSNLIAIIEVGEDKAVPWTKPDDMPFDPQSPLAGLGKSDDGRILTVFADSSVHSLPTDIAPETFRRLILRADGLPIDPNILK